MPKVIQTIGVWSLALLFLFLTLIYKRDMQPLPFFCALAFISLIMIFHSTIYKHFILSVKYKALLVFFMTFFSRLFYLVCMRNQIAQISDFHTTLHYAQTGTYTENIIYYSHFPHKLVYPLFLHSMGLDTQAKILMFQVICVSLIALSIYSIGKMMFSEQTGFFASLLYIFWPSQIVYTSIISEEHLGGLLTLSCFILIFVMQKKNKMKTPPPDHFYTLKTFAAYSLCGILCGLCVFFKDWCVIVLIASFITGILYISRFFRREILCIAIGFILLLSFRSITKQFITNSIESILDVNVNDNTIPCYMYVSLHPQNSGAWNPDRYNEYFSFVSENNFDYDKANKIALEKLKDLIEDSPDYLVTLIPLKIYDAYHDNEHMFFCAYIAMNEENQIAFKNFFDCLHTVDYIYYTIIILLVFASFFINLKRKSPKVFWLHLIIIGGILLVIFIESQSRYKYSVQPFWCVLSGFSLEMICHTLNQIKGHNSTNENKTYF